MNHAKWISHFARNRQHRAEPDWSAPIAVSEKVLPPLLRSLEQFRLGDGGGPPIDLEPILNPASHAASAAPLLQET